MKAIFMIEGDIWGAGDNDRDAMLDANDNLDVDILIDRYIDEDIFETLLDFTEHTTCDCSTDLYDALQDDMSIEYEIRNDIARLPGEIVLESERVEDLEKTGQMRIKGA